MNSKGALKIYIWPIIIALAFAILFPVVKNILEGEKGLIRRFILKGKRAVEGKSILTCIALISNDYQDKYGNDVNSLIYFTRETFRYYKELFVHIDKIDIELDEDKKGACVKIEGMIIGLTKKGEEERIFERESGKLILRLIKEGKFWRLLEIVSFEEITLMGKHIS